MLDPVFTQPRLPDVGTLVLLVAENERSELHRAVDEATGESVSRAVAAADYAAARSKTLSIPGPGAGLARIVLVGVGSVDDLDERAAEALGSTIMGAVRQNRDVRVDAASLPLPLVLSIATGIALSSYRFDRYRTRQKPEERFAVERLAIACADPDGAQAAWPASRAVLDGVALARDLVSEPANVLTPPAFAERIEALRPLGLEIEVFDPDDMERMGFGALLGVAQGSEAPARMAVLRWNNDADPAAAPFCFVGKGVTFDSGGISIKPAGGMEDMKWDMAGAAAVVGAMAALAGRRAPVNAVGIVGLVENMLSGRAQRPGDVVRSASGQTIEVINTDAEGRLVLADLLWYAQHHFKPRLIVDLATLTGAIIVALGHEHAGLFSNDDALAAALAGAGRATGEKLWRMPMGESYDKALRSEIADMKNIGGRQGSAIIAAQFLRRFVGDLPWAHLDIAGVAWSTKDGPAGPKGATSFGVRLLERFVRDHAGA
ncbi:MAG: leucyl aminopeptidase [Gluconacetobacter diazotrophicus]|nr:leucyl aminopeptidase [Gluconacetobacter diazotrophicus]